MNEPLYFDDEFKKAWRYSFDKARENREYYLNWLKDEIKIAITLINKVDKIYLLGGLGSRLLQSSPNVVNQFIAGYNGPDKEHAEKEEIVKDDEIETILEYAMNLASSSPNLSAGIIPTSEAIVEIRDQLSKIKFNVGFYEMSADDPRDGTDFNQWIKLRVMEDTLHVRGDGYQSHISEIYKETFAPHDDFLERFYGFNSGDILKCIEKLDVLVGSKIGNTFGGSLSHKRLIEWDKEHGTDEIVKKMMETGKHFISQFTEDNPDLYDERSPDSVALIPLDYIEGYNRLFWVIPKTQKEKKIFELLSHQFGENNLFVQGKYGGFPLGDSIIQQKPLTKVDDKYYCFSITLAFRNIFNITSNLLQTADSVYYEQKFKNNSNYSSRDNYIERKVKQLFEKMLPTVDFYHSLKYYILEDNLQKEPELDILGVSNDTIYIIEIKAGELNKKHRRGAILGLKDRLKETINEGSYQCFRAERYINDSDNPEFRYVDNNQRKILNIDKSKDYKFIKISVMYQHLATIAVNLKYLIESGVLSKDFKWTWIVSIFDLMIFAELIKDEVEFKEYIANRLGLYERSDVEFHDEIDILGYFFDNRFPLPKENPNEKILMVSFSDEIEDYFTKKDLGFPNLVKPKRKN